VRECAGELEPLPVLGMSRGEVSGVLLLCVALEPDANSASGELSARRPFDACSLS